MTLILNEIHLLDGLKKTMIIAAADRRISKPDGSYDSTQRKLFKIPYLDGAISYFGVANVFPKGKMQYLSVWLLNFIKTQAGVPDLQTFASNLRNDLNKVVYAGILQNNPSGFHICGYNDQRLPEFWFLTNIGGMEGYKYINFQQQYSVPTSDFLGRDAKNIFRWNGNNPSSARNGIQYYRNGDYRAHVVAWELLDMILQNLFTFPDFKRPVTPQEYGDYVKFKFEFIAYLYKKWAKKEIIARPIDVIVLNS